jgi:hypothetical protein
VHRDEAATLKELAKRFAAFRRSHKRFTRVPTELRAAVMAAMRRGVTATQLRRTCSISSSQLEQWGRAPGAAASSCMEAERARIFSVVDEVPSRASDSTQCTASDGFELRIGPWAVSVRLAETQEPGRG